jgi:rhodanese-related sulfurtransferase
VAQQLMEKGFDKVYALKGGWHEWENKKYPVEPK